MAQTIDSVSGGSSRGLVFTVGNAVVRTEENAVDGPQGPVHLEPKVMQVLTILHRHAGTVVTRGAIIDEVWGGHSGSDEGLSRAVSILRKALGPEGRKLIETVPKRGYLLRLRAGARSAPAAARIRLAVIPFEAPVTEDAAGLPAEFVVDELLRAFNLVSSLQIVAQHYEPTTAADAATVKQTGQLLGATHLAICSVTGRHPEVIVELRLGDCVTGEELCSLRTAGPASALSTLCRALSRDVAQALQAELPGEAPEIADLRARSFSRRAIELFVKGRALANNPWGEHHLKRAVELLSDAVDLDPDFAEAWAVLSYANVMLPMYEPTVRESLFLDAAAQAAERAIQIDGRDPICLTTLAAIHQIRKNYELASRLTEKSLELAPRNSRVLFFRGYHLGVIGRTVEAIECLQEAVDLDPRSGLHVMNLAQAQLNAGANAKAEQLAMRSLELGYQPAVFALADAMCANGKQRDAAELLVSVREVLAPFIAEPAIVDRWELLVRAAYEQDPDSQREARSFLELLFRSPDVVMGSVTPGVLQHVAGPDLFFQVMSRREFVGSPMILFRMWSQHPSCVAIRHDPGFEHFKVLMGLSGAL